MKISVFFSTGCAIHITFIFASQRLQNRDTGYSLREKLTLAKQDFGAQQGHAHSARLHDPRFNFFCVQSALWPIKSKAETCCKKTAAPAKCYSASSAWRSHCSFFKQCCNLLLSLRTMTAILCFTEIASSGQCQRLCY